MGTLADTLLTDTHRPNVIQSCVRLIDDEVGDKGGLSGLAIKTVYRTVKAFKRGIVPDVVNVLLNDFVGSLEPFYDEYQGSGNSDFAAYAVEHSNRVADVLLSITDRRAEKSRLKPLVKAYNKLRPQGKKQVVAAMPRIGKMLVGHGL